MPTVHYYPRKFFRLRGVAPPMRLAPRPGRAPRGWNGAYPLLRPEGVAEVTPSPAGKKRARAEAPTEEADEEVDPTEMGELQSGHFPATRGAVPRRRWEKMRRLLSDTAAAHAPLGMAEQSLDEPSQEQPEDGGGRADTLEGQPVDSDEGDREVVTGKGEVAEETAEEAESSVDRAGGEGNARPPKPSAANTHGHDSSKVQLAERVVNLRGRPRPKRHWDNATFPSQEEWAAPVGALEEEVEKDLGLGDHDPALMLQRKVDRELGVGEYDPRRLFQGELERDLGVPLGGIAGTSERVAQPELRRFITPDPSRSPSKSPRKRGAPDAVLAVAGDAGKTTHAQALAVGFSAHFLKDKTYEEVQLLLDSAASMREKTREETGLCAPRSLASVLEQALKVGFDVRYLASKSLDEAKALILYAASAATPLRRNSSLPGLTGEAEKSPADAPVPMNVKKPGPLMPDEADYSHSVNPSGDGIVSSHERALNLGFTADFLATKTKAEAQVLLDSVASISLRTKQTSGHIASLNLASTVDYALELGYALCFLANQSEEEIEQYVTSRVEKIEAERAIASKGTNVTLSDRESDVDDDEELNADDEDSDAGESDAEDEVEAEIQSDTSDEGSVQDEEDEEDSQSDRVDEGEISSDGMESSAEEDMISIVSSGEEQSMSGESNVADESSDDESDDDDDGVVRVGLPLGMRRSSSLSSLTRGGTAPSSAKASRFKSWMGRKQTRTVKPKPKMKKHRAANEERFGQHVEALKVYRERYGDYLVPSTYPILGRWVRTVRACHHDPEAKRSWALTEERREMLDEIGFHWERPAFRSHAYKTRARNITRAAVTMQSINDYNASLQQPIAPVEDSDPKATVVKQIAQHAINTEQHGQAHQMDKKYYAQGLAAGVEEVDLFHAFEEIGQGSSSSLVLQGMQDRKRKWLTTEDAAEIGPALVRSPRQPDEVFGGWLAERKQNWRQQQLRQWKTKTASAEGGASLSTRPESIEEFGHWLAVRKAIWKGKQRRKLRMVQDLGVDIADKRPPVVKKKAKRARKSSSSPEIDYGTCGVRYNPSGMWAVEVSVRSKLRYVGRFPSQENAALANRLFRDRIAAIVTPDQTPDEVNEAVKLARWTALQAIARKSSENSQSTPKKDERAPLAPREALEDEGLGQSQELSPSAQELTDYLISWLGQPGHTLMPTLDQKKLIMKATGVTKPRLESWLYRTRKRSESRGNGANGEESVVAKPLAPRQMTQPVAPGISQRSSGNWEVAPYFHGKKRYIGTFACPAQAKKANEIAREHLTMGDGPRPSDEEIEQAVKKARDAARPKDYSTQQKMQTVAPKAVSRKRESTSSSSVGVRQARSGRWEVGLRYGGTGRLQIGTFETKDEAILASTVARGILLKDSNGAGLAPEEIDRNVSLAREKAQEAVRKLNDEDDEPPTEEDELAILLRWDETGARSGPHLDQLQSEEGFVEWLAIRKERWRRQSGRVLKPRPIATNPKIQRESTATSSDGGDDEPPTEEDKLAILLKWDESGAWSGHHLPLSQLQSKEGFLRWLAIRKESWRRQSGRVLKLHTTKQRPEEHRCSYNCGAPFDLAPKECCTLNCSGLVHQICQQFYLRLHGKQVAVDDELRCKECSVWTESESQSKQGDSIEDKESTSPLLVLGANLPAGPATNDANTDDATAADSEDRTRGRRGFTVCHICSRKGNPRRRVCQNVPSCGVRGSNV